MATKAHLEGNKRYLEKLDHITIRVQGGTKEKIKARAQQEGRWISVDGRRADPGLFHGIWSKFCDIEAALGERNAHCDYSFSAFIRWRNADFGRR